MNYWWGMSSGAEEIDYSKDLPAGTLQLLDLMEKMLSENNLRIFPEDLYAQEMCIRDSHRCIRRCGRRPCMGRQPAGRRRAAGTGTF